DAWRANHAKAPGRAAAAAAEQQKIRMQSGHVAWTHAFGQVGKIDASGATAETDGNGTAFRLTAEKTTVGTPKGDLGPWRVTRGALRVGPFHASVTGTMTLFPDGARLALAWHAQQLKCEEIAQNAAKDALGDLGAQLGAFAKQLGVAKVTGEAHASGLLTID